MDFEDNVDESDVGFVDFCWIDIRWKSEIGINWAEIESSPVFKNNIDFEFYKLIKFIL